MNICVYIYIYIYIYSSPSRGGCRTAGQAAGFRGAPAHPGRGKSGPKYLCQPPNRPVPMRYNQFVHTATTRKSTELQFGRKGKDRKIPAGRHPRSAIFWARPECNGPRWQFSKDPAILDSRPSPSHTPLIPVENRWTTDEATSENGRMVSLGLPSYAGRVIGCW